MEEAVSDNDWAALIVPPSALVVFSVGALGLATSIFGRRAIGPRWRRMLGATKIDRRTDQTLSGVAWDIFFVVLGLGLLFALLTNGVRLGIPMQAAAGAVGFVLAAIICALIVRGSVRD